MSNFICAKRPGRLAEIVVLSLLCAQLTGGCAALRPETTPGAPALYSLDYARSKLPAAGSVKPDATASAPTLTLTPLRAAAGFDSRHIVYVQMPHKLDHFLHSEWVDTPARMLTPLVVASIKSSGAFGAVVHTPSSAGGDLRLDLEILVLQHEFNLQPSRVRFVLLAQLVEDKSRRVVASREFEAVAPAPSENPYGGVVAANQAVSDALEQLAVFCADVARNWRPSDKFSK